MFDAKTPEAAAYLAQREATEKSRQQVWRRVALVLGASLLIVTLVLVYVATSVSDIKSTVDSHTTTLSRQAQCQDQSFNAILKDARLAFTGDKNARDYAKAPRSC